MREDEAIIVAQINQSLTKKSPDALRSFAQSYEQLSNLVSGQMVSGFNYLINPPTPLPAAELQHSKIIVDDIPLVDRFRIEAYSLFVFLKFHPSFGLHAGRRLLLVLGG